METEEERYDSKLEVKPITIKIKEEQYEGAILIRGTVNKEDYVWFILREKQAKQLARDIWIAAKDVLIGNDEIEGEKC